ncbi:MAG: PEP-CTERM sorting domain-containing protein [Candidatus Hydrogenedentes bacterium]|nr:PEP-CTERM sorting domain-containing protein [Candidatus Hydrogenedentota bacterium]
MVKQSAHLAAAMGLLFFASTAGALTAPFGFSGIHVDAITIAPEPTSMLLLGMGLAAFMVRKLVAVRIEK